MPPKRRKITKGTTKSSVDFLGLGNLPDSLAPLVNYAQIANPSERLAAQGITHRHVQATLLPMLKEREFTYSGIDKIFACKWLDQSNILVGTKDNHLLKLNIDNGTSHIIPRPAEPPRTFSTANPGWGKCGIHSIDINFCGDLVATGGTDPADCVVLRTSDWTPVTTLIGHRDWIFGSAFVTDRHVVTGSRDGAMAVWTIDPEAYPQGPPTVQEYDYDDARVMKRKYEGKVREVKYDAQLGLVAGLGTEGVIKLHDPAVDLKAVRTLTVRQPRELVCMALRHDLVAAGGLSQVALLDPRKRDPGALLCELGSPDLRHGVRSVCLQDHILSYGTGMGKIPFWDIRNGKYLPVVVDPWESSKGHSATPGGGAPGLFSPGSIDIDTDDDDEGNASPHNPNNYRNLQAFFNLLQNHEEVEDGEMNDHVEPPPKQFLQTGGGWVHENTTFWDYFGGTSVDHACYAHAWDPAGSRLFACGGPLAFGLSGGYMALWE